MALNWSFKARLHNTTDTMKKRYAAVCDLIAQYPAVKTAESWDKVRVYLGRKTGAYLYFRGKFLCVALALDPADWENSNYVFEDGGDIDRFASTPVLIKMSSDRQVKSLAELLDAVFVGAEKAPVEHKTSAAIPFHTEEELIVMKLIKVYGAGAAEEEAAAIAAVAASDHPVEPVVEAAPAEEVAVEEPAVEPVQEEPVVETEPVVEPVKEEPVPEVVAPKVEPKPVAKKPAPAKRPIAVADASLIPQSAHKSPKGIVNIGALEEHFDNGAIVTPQALKDKGLVAKKVNCVKILASGSLTKQLNVAASKFSQSAKAAIVQAGGNVIVIPVK